MHQSCMHVALFIMVPDILQNIMQYNISLYFYSWKTYYELFDFFDAYTNCVTLRRVAGCRFYQMPIL